MLTLLAVITVAYSGTATTRLVRGRRGVEDALWAEVLVACSGMAVVHSGQGRPVGPGDGGRGKEMGGKEGIVKPKLQNNVPATLVDPVPLAVSNTPDPETTYLDRIVPSTTEVPGGATLTLAQPAERRRDLAPRRARLERFKTPNHTVCVMIAYSGFRGHDTPGTLPATGPQRRQGGAGENSRAARYTLSDEKKDKVAKGNA